MGLCGASCCGSSEMSHAIPRHVFQTLKLHRWNCNVLGCCTKFGYPNCVRVLVDEAPKASSCVRSLSHDTVHNPRDASTTTPTPHNAKSRFRWMGPTMRMDKSCCWEGDFSALLRGKVTFLVGRVCLVPVNTASCSVCGCPMIRHGKKSTGGPLKIAVVEVRSSSRTSTSTHNPRPIPGHPHSTRKSRK